MFPTPDQVRCRVRHDDTNPVASFDANLLKRSANTKDDPHEFSVAPADLAILCSKLVPCSLSLLWVPNHDYTN